MSNNVIEFVHNGEVLGRGEQRIACIGAKCAGLEWLLDNWDDLDFWEYRNARLECADGTVVNGIKCLENYGHMLAGLLERYEARINYMRNKAYLERNRV